MLIYITNSYIDIFRIELRIVLQFVRNEISKGVNITTVPYKAFTPVN